MVMTVQLSKKITEVYTLTLGNFMVFKLYLNKISKLFQTMFE